MAKIHTIISTQKEEKKQRLTILSPSWALTSITTVLTVSVSYIWLAYDNESKTGLFKLRSILNLTMAVAVLAGIPPSIA